MLGIYIHIPFCKKKCSYCDFTSFTNISWVEEYISALKKEIELTSQINKSVVDSVFIGGGTPSYVESKYIGDILEFINKNYTLQKNCEITIESNPNSLTRAKLNDYLSFGINRLSIGLQAVQNELLKYIGRLHKVEDFKLAYENARNAGFKNINVDLIYGLPYQRVVDFYETLCYVIELKPEHISAYSLKLEEGTKLCDMHQNNEFKKVDEDGELRMYHLAQNIFLDNGYLNYEISNFALAGYACEHNLKYWNLKDYLGVGVSAASNVGDLRFSHGDNIEKYISNLKSGKLIYDENELISNKQKKYEYVMLKTRLKSGINFNEYKRLFKCDFLDDFAQGVIKALEYNLILLFENSAMPTKKGFDLQNQLVLILTENL